MKLKILIVGLCVLLVGAFAYASTELRTATSSGAVTDGTKQVRTGTCQLTGIVVFTDGSNDGTVTIYDGTADTDKKVWYT